VGDMLSRDHRKRLVQRTNVRPEILPLGAIENRPQYSRNMLLLDRGDGTYAEIAQFAGLEASEWHGHPFFSMSISTARGFVDRQRLSARQHEPDALDAMQRAGAGQRASSESTFQLRRLFPKLATANLAFHNLRGLKFEETGRQWGFDTEAISQGMCLAIWTMTEIWT